MAIVNEIKCARCDRKYSGVRSRCPYCGARRIGRGKYSDDSSNAKGKMLISVIIMAVFAIGAAVLLFSSVETDYPPANNGEASLGSPEDDVDVIQGVHPEPTPTPTPVPTPEIAPPLEIESITITFDGNRRDDITMSIGEVVPLRVRVEPPGAEDGIEIIWSSSNRDVFDVVVVPGLSFPGQGVNITAIGRGVATLTVAIGDDYATCIIRVN